MKERIERLCKYMEIKGLNANQVETLCGLAKGTISQARKGKSDLGQKSIQRITEKFADLNRAWLLGGEGNMLIEEGAIGSNITNSTIGNSNFQTCKNDEKFLDLLKMQGEQLTIALRTIEILSRGRS